MSKIFIAAHHYQNETIVAKGDLVADSYKLAVEAAQSDAKYIVVCGVRFMAESVATLARKDQIVLHPNAQAGCPMADMVTRGAAERALKEIKTVTGKEPIPITYMNSSNSVKALTGERGGAICTSGNAKKILATYLLQERPILFMPDYNLGANTARELEIPVQQRATINRDGTIRHNEDDISLSQVKIFLWDGFCPIHKVMTVEDIEQARKTFPDASITVHPECTEDVVLASDKSGSTEGMRQQLTSAPDGSTWIVGTEIHFVERMSRENPTKKILPLRPSSCLNMIMITPEKLAQTLQAIENYEKTGEPLDIVTIPDDERENAKLALTRMVEITNA